MGYCVRAALIICDVRRTIEALVTITEKWHTLASLPEARQWECWGSHPGVGHAGDSYSSCVMGTRLYLIGGRARCHVTDSVYILETTTAVWSQGPALISARAEHSCCVVGNLIYVVGGSDSGNPHRRADTVEVWNTDAASEGWGVLSVM